MLGPNDLSQGRVNVFVIGSNDTTNIQYSDTVYKVLLMLPTLNGVRLDVCYKKTFAVSLPLQRTFNVGSTIT